MMANIGKPNVNLTPPPPMPVAPVVTAPTDKRPQKKSMTPTFLGQEQTPQFAAASGGGGKTLLGG
jgi:hypothetical protein